MAEDSKYWRVRVLDKLRHLILNSSLSGVIKWSYDSDTSRISENKALMYLSSLGVVDVSALDPNVYDPFAPNEDGVFVPNGKDSIIAYAMEDATQGEAVLDTKDKPVDMQRYGELCRHYGLNPHEETYLASLTIVGMGTPIVMINGEQYRFNAMHAGKGREALFDYLKEHPKVEVKLAEIIKLEGLEDATNINQLLLRSPFDRASGGVLSPFVLVVKDSVTFYPQRYLTAAQINAIKGYKKLKQV